MCRTDEIAAVLAAKAAEIEAEIAAITVPMESPGSTVQFGKRAGDSTAAAAEQLSRVASHEQMLAISADVARAREKVAEGSYGTCDVCGKPVGDEAPRSPPVGGALRVVRVTPPFSRAAAESARSLVCRLSRIRHDRHTKDRIRGTSLAMLAAPRRSGGTGRRARLRA